mmetsp:Transcript_5811/g.9895  ORF Transcript_5811/g.9895 Transcript_5811/m.9895 type:complete len:375 (+) Transcript_5811:113-1237(+)
MISFLFLLALSTFFNQLLGSFVATGDVAERSNFRQNVESSSNEDNVALPKSIVPKPGSTESKNDNSSVDKPRKKPVQMYYMTPNRAAQVLSKKNAATIQQANAEFVPLWSAERFERRKREAILKFQNDVQLVLRSPIVDLMALASGGLGLEAMYNAQMGTHLQHGEQVAAFLSTLVQRHVSSSGTEDDNAIDDGGGGRAHAPLVLDVEECRNACPVLEHARRRRAKTATEPLHVDADYVPARFIDMLDDMTPRFTLVQDAVRAECGIGLGRGMSPLEPALWPCCALRTVCYAQCGASKAQCDANAAACARQACDRAHARRFDVPLFDSNNERSTCLRLAHSHTVEHAPRCSFFLAVNRAACECTLSDRIKSIKQ